MQRVAQLPQQGAQATRRVQILQVVLAGRLEVHQHRRLVRELIEPLQSRSRRRGGLRPRSRWITALVEPPIASSTRSAFSTDLAVMISLGFGPPLSAICAARRPLASAMRKRSACTAGIAALSLQPHPQRFGDAGHGAGGAHHRTGPRGGREVALDRVDAFVIDAAGPVLGPVAPAVGTCTQPLAVPGVGQHRSGDELHGRQIGRGRAHQLRRHGLVATADQHHRIHRLGPDHLLGVHRHQVAEHQAGRDSGRSRPARWWGTPAAARRRVSTPRFTASTSSGIVRWQLLKPLAVCAMPDDGTIEHLQGVAHRARERAAQVQREAAVAVVGEVAAQAFGVSCAIGGMYPKTLRRRGRSVTAG